MEEARMATAETLKVANRVDDKVTVLIDGMMCFSACLRIPEHGYGSKRAVCEHRRSREAFVLSSYCSRFMGFIYPHREPVTRETAEVALSPGSLDKP
jgi:hypothetical protein